jgi:excisionase family DNA binding protein
MNGEMNRIEPQLGGAIERSLRLNTAASILSVSVRTVRRWIDRGELKVFRIGRCVCIAQTELERFVAARKANT